MEIKIQIPDNCELIKDGNTYIVKEKKQVPPRSWEEFCKNHPRTMDEYFIRDDSSIEQVSITTYPRKAVSDRNICTSKEEAEAFLALMQLRQLRKAWVGDNVMPYLHNSIVNSKCDGIIVKITSFPHPLIFPNKEMAEDFLYCFKDLCETAKVLL